jgi:hypothetical protein
MVEGCGCCGGGNWLCVELVDVGDVVGNNSGNGLGKASK